MWMTDYIREIQRRLLAEHGTAVPDGRYPMVLNGKLDNVEIRDGKIFCCNFNKGQDNASDEN